MTDLTKRRPARVEQAMRFPGGWRTQFVELSAIWGSSFLFIKVLDRRWSPTWVAFGRVALGAATLMVLILARGERLRIPRGAWPHIFAAALFMNAIPFTLLAFGERHVSSVVAGLWNASAPLWVLAVMLAFADEHPTKARAAGLAFGFAGVVLLLGPWRGLGGGEAIGHLACAGAAVCYGIGFPYARRHVASRPESGLMLAAAQLLCAAAVLALLISRSLAVPPPISAPEACLASSCSGFSEAGWRTCSITRSSELPGRPRRRP